MNTQVNGAGALAVAVAIVVATFLAMMRVDTYLRYMGINECGKLATATTENLEERARFTMPMDDIYKACLKDKGIVIK